MLMNFERRGTGRPLVLVHGLGGSARSWDTVAPQLAASRELIVLEMPGHGRTPPLAGPPTIAAYADAIAQFLDTQGLQAADMVGSSVGARLVLELSRRGMGGHCVALDPGGFWQGWETHFFHITLAASIRLVRLLQPIMPFLSRHAFTRTLLLAQLSARPWALAPEIVLTEMRSFAATPVFDAMLHELAVGPLQQGTTTTPGRVTIGWGVNDRLLLLRQAARAQAAFPAARLHLFGKCGHFPQWDQPADTIRVIQETIG